METLIDPESQQAYASLFTDRMKDIPDFIQGETRPLTVGLLDEIVSPSGARLWDPRDLTGWTFRAALGKGFLAPVAGTWPITWEGDDAEGISFAPTASELETALNDLASVIAAGGLTVSGGNGYFQFTWNEVGARSLLSGDNSDLAPLTILDFGTLIEGSASRQEVQTLRIVQNPGAYCSLATASDAAAATVSVVQVGGAGLNAKVRVTLDPLPYGGAWSILVRGIESALADYDTLAADLVSALEGISISSGSLVTGAKYKIVTFATLDVFTNVGAASNATGIVFVASGTTPTTWTHGSVLSPVGAGNVAVTREAVGQYLIAFQGDMANTAMGTITADASGLLVTGTKGGTLDVRTAAIALLLEDEPSKQVVFEVEGTPPAGTVEKLLRRDVALLSTIFSPSSSQTPPAGDGALALFTPFLAYTGSDGALDAYVTSGLGIGSTVFTLVSGSLKAWELVADTTHTSDVATGWIRPLDYDASTNAKAWKQCL